MAKRRIDPEHLFEMRAAFGEDENIVNVLTGERHNLRTGFTEEPEEEEEKCPKCGGELDYRESPSMVGYDFDWSIRCLNTECDYKESGHPDFS